MTNVEFDDTGTYWVNGDQAAGWPSYTEHGLWFCFGSFGILMGVVDDFGNIVEVDV